MKQIKQPSDRFDDLMLCPSGDGSRWAFNRSARLTAKINGFGDAVRYVRLPAGPSTKSAARQAITADFHDFPFQYQH